MLWRACKDWLALFSMEVIPETAPQTIASGALIESERAHKLGEAVGLAVEQIIEPLSLTAFASKLLGSVIPDATISNDIMAQVTEECRSSFKVWLLCSENHKIRASKFETIPPLTNSILALT